MIKVRRNINNQTVEFDVDEKDFKEAMALAITICVQDYCDNCKNRSGIVWQTNRAESKKDGKMYTYVKRRCLKCFAESTLGSYADGRGYFWKRFEVYQGKQGQNNQQGNYQNNQPQYQQESPKEQMINPETPPPPDDSDAPSPF